MGLMDSVLISEDDQKKLKSRNRFFSTNTDW